MEICDIEFRYLKIDYAERSSEIVIGALKDNVEDLMNKGKIRANQSLYGAPFFFVKDKDKL